MNHGRSRVRSGVRRGQSSMQCHDAIGQFAVCRRAELRCFERRNGRSLRVSHRTKQPRDRRALRYFRQSFCWRIIGLMDRSGSRWAPSRGTRVAHRAAGHGRKYARSAALRGRSAPRRLDCVCASLRPLRRQRRRREIRRRSIGRTTRSEPSPGTLLGIFAWRVANARRSRALDGRTSCLLRVTNQRDGAPQLASNERTS